MIRNIEYEGSHFLKEPTRKVEWPLTKEVQQVIQDLKDTMEATGRAAGIAAPQIGSSVSILIYRTSHTKPTIMINPRIVKARDMEPKGKYEMCLSFPDQIFEVPRYKNITVYYEDESGKPYVLKYRGFEARVLQHETDHLLGLTMADKGKKLSAEETAYLLEAIRHGEEEA